MIDVSRLTGLEDIDATLWNDVLGESEIREIFLTYEWITCWWNCFASGKELFTLIAREADEIIGIAPLMLSSRGRGKFKYTVIEFLGTGESDYCDFIISPGNKERVVAAILNFLVSQSELWDVISLTNIPERSSTIIGLESNLNNLSYRSRKVVSFHCPTMLLEDNPTFASECLKKKSLRRHFNHLDKSGCLTFETAQTRDEILDELENFFRQHIERRAIAGGLSKFEDLKVREFYRCLVTHMLPAGWLKFGIVRHDGTPIAYHFGFEYFGKFIWYKPTFNIDYITKSPGEVLIKYLLEDAIKNQVAEFDFTIGDEAFKRRFSNEIRNNIQLEIVKSRNIWVAQNAANASRKFFKRRLPGIYSFVKRHLEYSQRDEFKRKCRDAIDKNGAIRAGLKGIDRAIRYCFFDVNLILVYEGRPLQGLTHELPTGHTIQEGQVSDSRYFVQNCSPLQQKNLISTWFERSKQGDRLFVGRINDYPVYYAWVAISSSIRIPGIASDLKLSGDAAVIHDWHFAEDHRETALYAAAAHCLAKQLQQSGSNRILVCCYRKDPAARKRIETAGFEVLAMHKRIRILGIPLILQRPAAGITL